MKNPTAMVIIQLVATVPRLPDLQAIVTSCFINPL
jgi:hypothetical protein